MSNKYEVGKAMPERLRAELGVATAKEAADIVMNLLPHGSGIDCKWNWFIEDNGDIAFHNSYHRMNDGGYYVGWINFKVILKAVRHTTLWRLRGACINKVQIADSVGDLHIDVSGFGHHQDVGDWIYDCTDTAIGSVTKALRSPWSYTTIDPDMVDTLACLPGFESRQRMADRVWGLMQWRHRNAGYQQPPLLDIDIARCCDLAARCRKLIRNGV